MEKYTTINIKLASNSGSSGNIDYEFDTDNIFSRSGQWLGDRFQDGIDFVVVEPFIQALTNVFRAVLSSFMYNLPMFLTLMGLVCFLLSMVFGKQKPYMWGVGFWGLSALVGVLNVELGIK